MGGGAWWAIVHGVAKSLTQLRDSTFTFHFHALEREMATHSSGLAWRIPGAGEPGGLPSMGSHSSIAKLMESANMTERQGFKAAQVKPFSRGFLSFAETFTQLC